MTDRWDEFDCALATSLSELPPPEETVRTVTPFRTAMERIVLGLCLTCFTLHFLYLDYLLPAAGTMALYLGFRSLRKNNCWFQIGWIISGCKVIILYANFILQATPLWGRIPELPTPLLLLMAVPTLALFLCLWLGLAAAAAEVGRPRKTAAPALWALVWYAVLTGFALLWPTPGWISLLVMAYAFYRIVKSLLRAGTQLSDWGYAVRAAPVKLSGGKLTAAYLLSLVGLTIVMSLFSNHLPMESQAIEQTSESTEITSIQTHLEDLGFPEELLDLLPEEEIMKLSGAEACYVDLEAWGDSTDNGTRYTDIQVQTGFRTFRCYHFFTVNTSRAVLQNQVRMESDTHATVNDVAGQLLWRKDGTWYAADLSLEMDSYITYFGDTYDSYSALFSYPFGTTERRGWCAYTASFSNDWLYGVTILRYQTQALRNLYPYAPLPEQPAVGLLNDMESQSYTTYPLEPQYAEDLET